MTPNYLSEQELNEVKGLMHYLNQSMTPTSGACSLTADVKLVDSNGETAGIIEYISEPGAGYVLRLPS